MGQCVSEGGERHLSGGQSEIQSFVVTTHVFDLERL